MSLDVGDSDVRGLDAAVCQAGRRAGERERAAVRANTGSVVYARSGI
jgi:hypothetical protein